MGTHLPGNWSRAETEFPLERLAPLWGDNCASGSQRLDQSQAPKRELLVDFKVPLGRLPAGSPPLVASPPELELGKEQLHSQRTPPSPRDTTASVKWKAGLSHWKAQDNNNFFHEKQTPGTVPSASSNGIPVSTCKVVGISPTLQACEKVGTLYKVTQLIPYYAKQCT